jgi:hypothetical protein
MDWRNILERSLWTALEAGLAAIPVSQLAALFAEGELTGLVQLALVGLGAAIGALIAFLKTVATERLKVLGA